MKPCSLKFYVIIPMNIV